jgi:hypothetical protein
VKIPSSTGFSNKLTNSGNVTNTNPKYTWGLTNNISWRDLNRKSYT